MRRVSSTGLLLQLDDLRSVTTTGPGTQVSRLDSYSTDFIPALRNVRRSVTAPPAHISSGRRTPRPRPGPPRVWLRSPATKPSWLRGAHAQGLSLPLSTPGGVVFVRTPVGRRSPASRRNLEKSEHSRHPRPHSHLHTCPVTSRSLSVPGCWASVSARPQEERETFSSLQLAVPEEAGSTARPLPPPPSPPGGYRAGARREAAAPAAAAGGAAAAGAAGNAPARLLRRGTVRAAAGKLAGGSGCGGCSRGAESWRRRRS